jgi:hypothetical protein
MLLAMGREKNQVPATKGLTQLVELLKDKNQKDFALENKIPQSVISEIVNRKRLPSLEQALILQKHGIEPAAWAEEVEAA